MSSLKAFTVCAFLLLTVSFFSACNSTKDTSKTSSKTSSNPILAEIKDKDLRKVVKENMDMYCSCLDKQGMSEIMTVEHMEKLSKEAEQGYKTVETAIEILMVEDIDSATFVQQYQEYEGKFKEIGEQMDATLVLFTGMEACQPDMPDDAIKALEKAIEKVYVKDEMSNEEGIVAGLKFMEDFCGYDSAAFTQLFELMRYGSQTIMGMSMISNKASMMGIETGE